MAITDPRSTGFYSPMEYDAILRQMTVEKAKTPQLPSIENILPPWASEPDPSDFNRRLTLMGLLFLRLYQVWSPVHGGAMRGLFSVGHVSFFGATKATYEGNPVISIFTMVEGEAMVLHDDAHLFPSDTLLAKIIMLKDTTKG